MKTEDIELLRRWFQENKREFPWRKTESPYHVWVSEVMLQQTQASVVVDYYQRFLNLFPSVKDLAQAPIEKVIKAWEGLGYYSRARRLHQGAKIVCEQFGGEVPIEEDKLKSIKGLGPYTIGAIRSFAFKQKAAAVDGNVLRVLSRYYAIGDDISKQTVQERFRLMTQQFLPSNKPWEIMEACIELGALVCKKMPVCAQCPVNQSCLAYQMQQETLYPYKKKQIPIQALLRAVFIVTSGDYLLVKKGSEGKIMADLYEFPYCELEETQDVETLQETAQNHFQAPLELERVLPSSKQAFTRYRVTLFPILFKTNERQKMEGYEWKKWGEIEMLPFSSGHRRILNHLSKYV